MLIGYARVSKADGSQSLDLQRDALIAAGVPPEAIYEDQASGKRDNRPGLDACLKALRGEDTLIVWNLDRLERDLRHLVNVVQVLSEREIGLRVLAGQGAQIDTTTAAGRPQPHVLHADRAWAHEFERIDVHSLDIGSIVGGVGAREQLGGDTLGVGFHLPGRVVAELELAGEDLVDPPAKGRPVVLLDLEVSSQIEQGALTYFGADSFGANEALGEVRLAGVGATGLGAADEHRGTGSGGARALMQYI